jgi:hypothetical protein
MDVPIQLAVLAVVLLPMAAIMDKVVRVAVILAEGQVPLVVVMEAQAALIIMELIKAMITAILAPRHWQVTANAS